MVYFIVEGQTDKALIENILYTSGVLKNSFEFKGLKGDGSIKQCIKGISEKDTSQHSYFTIVDADSSFINREKEVKGWIGDKEINFYIFPNNKDNGNLEDLILHNIGDEDEVIKCFNSYKECIKNSIKKDIINKHKLYAYTTLQHNQKPEEYIKELDLKDNFDVFRKEITSLF